MQNRVFLHCKITTFTWVKDASISSTITAFTACAVENAIKGEFHLIYTPKYVYRSWRATAYSMCKLCSRGRFGKSDKLLKARDRYIVVEFMLVAPLKPVD